MPPSLPVAQGLGLSCSLVARVLQGVHQDCLEKLALLSSLPVGGKTKKDTVTCFSPLGHPGLVERGRGRALRGSLKVHPSSQHSLSTGHFPATLGFPQPLVSPLSFLLILLLPCRCSPFQQEAFTSLGADMGDPLQK